MCRVDIKKRGSEPLLVSNWDAYNVNAVLAWRLVQVDRESLPTYPVPDCHYCPELSLAKLQGVRLFTRALGAQQIRVRSRLVGKVQLPVALKLPRQRDPAATGTATVRKDS